METENAELFDSPVRTLGAKVYMAFYAGETALETTASMGKTDSDSGAADEDENTGPWSDAKKLTVAGRSITKRYASFDGHTVLPETADKAVGDCEYYALESGGECTLWSSTVSSSAAEDNGAYKFDTLPFYSVSYNRVCKTNRIYLIGDTAWAQYPVDFTVELKLSDNATDADFDSWNADLADYDEVIVGADSVSQGEKADGNYLFVTVKNNSFSRCVLLLPKTYEVTAMTVKLQSWSAPHTCAKMQFFAGDLSVTFGSDEIAEIEVLEEKTEDVNVLNYGLTSNSCKVRVYNYNDRFLKNRELLRENRVIQPFAQCEGRRDGDIIKSVAPLGKFYSQQWEVSSDSAFITCTAYDVLYNLQNMTLSYPLELVNGAYVQAGTQSGAGAQNAYQVYEKLFSLINSQKADNGIYGPQIEYEIDGGKGTDSALSAIEMPRVMLGTDSAWNMLSQLANFTGCYVYVDREGRVVVSPDASRPSVRTSAAIMITPDNCFSYNLPAMSRTVVNRVKVPYTEVKTIGVEPQMELQIGYGDTVPQRDALGRLVRVNVRKPFEKNYCALQVSKIDLSSPTHKISNLTVSYDSLGFTLENVTEQELFNFNMTVTLTDVASFDIEQQEKVSEDYLSQGLYGVYEFPCECGNLALGAETAAAIGNRIVDFYKGGKEYIEAIWTGTPALKLGDEFDSRTVKDEKVKRYECLANEFRLGDGLRMTTRARQK